MIVSPSGARRAPCSTSSSIARRQLRVRADAIRRRDELAVDDDRRHRLDVVLLRELHRALHLAGDRERLVHSSTFLRSSPCVAAQSKKLVVSHSATFRAVDRLEHLGRQLRLLAERVERVVDLRERHPALLEHHRHAAELTSGGSFASHARGRLELGAMRAAVREELDHLDLLAGLDRLRILEARVVLAFVSCAAALPSRTRAAASSDEQRSAAIRVQSRMLHGVSWGIGMRNEPARASMTAVGRTSLVRRACGEFRAHARRRRRRSIAG